MPFRQCRNQLLVQQRPRNQARPLTGGRAMPRSSSPVIIPSSCTAVTISRQAAVGRGLSATVGRVSMLVQVEIRPNDAVLRLMECRATVRPVAPLGVRDRAPTGGFDELGRVSEQTESGGCRVVIERQGDEKGA